MTALPRVVRIISNKLVTMDFKQYTAFNVVGMPQRIEGAFTDPEDNVVWQITLTRLN